MVIAKNKTQIILTPKEKEVLIDLVMNFLKNNN